MPQALYYPSASIGVPTCSDIKSVSAAYVFLRVPSHKLGCRLTAPTAFGGARAWATYSASMALVIGARGPWHPAAAV